VNTEDSDLRLLASRALAGEAEANEAFANRVNRLIWSCVRKAMPNRLQADMEDVVNDVWVAITKNLERIGNGTIDPLGGWVWIVTQRRIARYYRDLASRKLTVRIGLTQASNAITSVEPPDPKDEITRKEVTDAVRALEDRLSPNEAAVFTLLAAGYSPAQIAREYGVHRATVGRWIVKIRRKAEPLFPEYRSQDETEGTNA